jgi:hypothetical protein
MSTNNGNHDSNKQQNMEVTLLDSLGGESLEGSGFEEETPESSYEWEDPR